MNTENFLVVNNFLQVEKNIEKELQHFLRSFEEEYGNIFDEKILTSIFYHSLTLILDVDDTVVKSCDDISVEKEQTGQSIPPIVKYKSGCGLIYNIRATDMYVINFINKTVSNGVRVIFLSSREKGSETATIKELRALGVENPIVYCIGSISMVFLVPEISLRFQILSKGKWAKDNLFSDEYRKNNLYFVVDDRKENLAEFPKFFDHSAIRLLQYTYERLD
jgi:hypothetical protein